MRSLPSVCSIVFLFPTVAPKADQSGKLKSLAELFTPPSDIMFVGTFEEVQ